MAERQHSITIITLRVGYVCSCVIGGLCGNISLIRTLSVTYLDHVTTSALRD